jgi:hypothetical protein
MSERQRRGKTGGAGAHDGHVAHLFSSGQVDIVAHWSCTGPKTFDPIIAWKLNRVAAWKDRPQSKVFLPYPQTKICGVIAKLDQLRSLPTRGGGSFVFALAGPTRAKPCCDFRPLLKRNSPSPKIPLSLDCHNRVIAPEIKR